MKRNVKNRHCRILWTLGAAFCLAHPVLAEDNLDYATSLAILFRSCRAVISDNQALINDPEKGDKGLNSAAVTQKCKEKYKAKLNKDVPSDKAHDAMLQSASDIMDKSQNMINEKGKGFKGFIPAVFAKHVADGFSKKMEDKAFIKLTAPISYVRNRANKPDDWEVKVIEEKFKSASWTKDKEFSEDAPHKGKTAFRLMLPEYYGDSCLSCHGDPKGEKDITGGTKEGGKLGDLGGAISVALYK
jgi:hypothetical protein